MYMKQNIIQESHIDHLQKKRNQFVMEQDKGTPGRVPVACSMKFVFILYLKQSHDKNTVCVLK